MTKGEIIRDIFRFNKRFMPEELTDEEKYQWMQKFIMYTTDELMEVLEELPFKHWKDYSVAEVDDQRIIEELADVLIFTFGMVDIMGFDDEDIFKEIAKKNRVNNVRQEEGY